MLESSTQINPGDMAIVGMALRVPGARNTSEFWRNLREGVESIRALSPEELAESGEASERVHNPNYVRRTADLPDMEMFDADFFGMSPKEAAIMDPQHRHFLECAWEALEDAGRTPDASTGPVGVFAGSGMGSYFYFNVCSNRQLVEQVGMFLLRHTGNDKDFLATRASFTFDLRGPSVNVQTACSTSLVAVHYACQSLLNGECDMALAGGVTIELPHRRGYMFHEGEILSPDGHCRAFDHRAAGTVFGSGVGVVALRRLSDAIRDGDIIHAVIKGTAVNNDGGNKAGYLAPSVTGQAEAVIEAQGLAGISANSLQYVECHGTGTFLGDPIEIEALTQAFRQSTDRTGFCRIGSVKSNIGHLDTAAGVVSLIKVALSLKHGEIPPTLGFEKPNPSIDFASSPFIVNDRLTKWPLVDGPRCAAVNSLGVGGTNAHAILEQAPTPAPNNLDKAAEEPLLLLLSARHRKILDQAKDRLASALSDQPRLSLDDVAYTLYRGRKHFEHRLVVALDAHDNASSVLSNLAVKRTFIHSPVEALSGAVFLFPGGGAQHPGMAQSLYGKNAEFRASIDEGLSHLPVAAADEIREAWFGGSADAGFFLRPSVQLPAILIVEIAMSRLWMTWGIKPTALIGHSMGENAAACIAGVMTYRDAVNLVRLRGELFDAIEAGGMISVPLDATDLSKLLPPELDMASINAPQLCVVSGRNEDLETFCKALSERGVDASRVPINIAAHSRMLDPILGRFETFLRTLALRPPSIRMISNRSGDWLTAEEATNPLYWVGHLRSTVQFAKGMSTLSKDPGRVYIEVGPGRTLSSLAKAQGSIDANQIINSLPHPEDVWDDRMHFLTSLGRAWATGLPVSIERLWHGRNPRRVPLPTYAFQHRRYFIERAAAGDGHHDDENTLIKEPDITCWGYRPAWKQTLADYTSGSKVAPSSWLFFLDDAGIGRKLVEDLRAEGNRVVAVSLGDAFIQRGGDEYVLCPEIGRTGYDALLSSLTADGVRPARIVHMWLLTEKESFRPGSNFFHRNQECGFDSLLYLSQALGDIGSPTDVHITVVTNGMQRVADEAVPYPEKATILGPGLVLPKEMVGATVRLIDVDLPVKGPAAPAVIRWRPRSSAQVSPQAHSIIEQLWKDILATAGCETVAYRKGQRWSRVYEKLPLNSPDLGKEKFKQNGVYFFTGGLGDLSLVLAGELADRFKARLVLTARLDLPPRDQWTAYDRLHGHDAVRRATSAIRALEKKGAEVLYIKADVSNPQQMSDAVSAALEHFGEINGVFHAAGVVDDDLMQVKSEERIKRVLAPKIIGTAVLHDVLKTVQLDLIILFSSTSTDTAPAGQVDYVAANAYLNAYAESRFSETDRLTRAIHWGIWNEVGLAARATNSSQSFNAPMSVAGPALGPCFERWIEDESGRPWLELTISPESHWILDEHRLVTGTSVMPGTGYIELITQAAREYGLPFQAEIVDLIFLKPLIVEDGAKTILRVRFEPLAEGGYQATVAALTAGTIFEKHAEATFNPKREIRLESLDIGSASARCNCRRRSEPGSTLRPVQADHVRFGRRWDVLKSVAFGMKEAIAELELNEAYRTVDASIAMHPALLDIATGYAMELAKGYGLTSVLWVPVTYGCIVLHKPLPTSIISWVTLADDSEFGEGYAVFDIAITDPDGFVLFEARRFVMKQLTGDAMMGPSLISEGMPAGPSAPRQVQSLPAMLKLSAQMSQGILPTEGFEALLRALETAETQPIISSMNLDVLRKSAALATKSSAVVNEGFERPDLESEYVAPRNSVEETISLYWRELLGIAQIGVHDSFFDMGGHSLIAVRLFRMIKKRYELDFPISILFEAPTIAQCADLVLSQRPEEIQGYAAPEGDRPTSTVKPIHLVAMHKGADVNTTPLFICAGMFGNILNLRHLAASLGSTRPIYGLQARGLYGDQDPHETFEEMAKDYIAEIRMVQPHGPYLLAGYSGGGIAAYEIAHQLQQAGEQISHLIMLDTPLTTQPAISLRDRGQMKLQDLYRQKGAFLQTWLRSRALWKTEKKQKRDAELQGTLVEEFNNRKIENAFRRALQRYDLKPHHGAVTLLRPKPSVHYKLSDGRRLNATRDIILDDNGWTPHIADLHVVEVPGDHDSMVLEPYVRVLAERMHAALLRAPLPPVASSEIDATRVSAAATCTPERAAEFA